MGRRGREGGLARPFVFCADSPLHVCSEKGKKGRKEGRKEEKGTPHLFRELLVLQLNSLLTGRGLAAIVDAEVCVCGRGRLREVRWLASTASRSADRSPLTSE